MQTSNAISRSAAAALTDGGAAKDRHALPAPTTRRFDAILHVIEVVLREMRVPEPATRVALARLTEVLARILDLAPQPQETLRDFTRRLAAHMDTLPASTRALIEKQLNQPSLMSALKLLVESLRPGLTFDLSIDMPVLHDRLQLGSALPDLFAAHDDRSAYRPATIQVPLPTRMAFPQAPGVSPGAPHLQQALGQAFSPEVGSPVRASVAIGPEEGDEPLPAFREATAFLASDRRALAKAVLLARGLSVDGPSAMTFAPERPGSAAPRREPENAAFVDQQLSPDTSEPVERAGASRPATTPSPRAPQAPEIRAVAAPRRDGQQTTTFPEGAASTAGEPDTVAGLNARAAAPRPTQASLPSTTVVRTVLQDPATATAPSPAAVHAAGRREPAAPPAAPPIARPGTDPVASLHHVDPPAVSDVAPTGVAFDMPQLPLDPASALDMRATRFDPDAVPAKNAAPSALRRTDARTGTADHTHAAPVDAGRPPVNAPPPVAVPLPSDLREAVKALARFDEWETLFYMLSGSQGDLPEEERAALAARAQPSRDGKPLTTRSASAPGTDMLAEAGPLDQDGKTNPAMARGVQADDSQGPAPGGRGVEPGLTMRVPLGFAFIPYQPVDLPADGSVEDGDDARRRPDSDAAGSDDDGRQGGKDAPGKRSEDSAEETLEDGVQDPQGREAVERHDAYDLYQRLSDLP